MKKTRPRQAASARSRERWLRQLERMARAVIKLGDELDDLFESIKRAGTR